MLNVEKIQAVDVLAAHLLLQFIQVHRLFKFMESQVHLDALLDNI